jgi:hypothetical protein
MYSILILLALNSNTFDSRCNIIHYTPIIQLHYNIIILHYYYTIFYKYTFKNIF